MAINYFENLGFGNFGERQQQAAMGAQNMRANEQAMRMNESNMQRQVKADEQAMLKFKDEQQKQRAAQGAGAFYQRLNAGDTQGALQVASQYQDDINNLGDPSFTVDSVAELIKTPQGVEQLKQMSLGMVQLAAGPEQFARFTAQQAKPAEQQQAPVSVQEQQYYQKLQQTDPVAAEAYGRKAGFISTGREQAETPQERNLAKYEQLVAAKNPNAESFAVSTGLKSKEGRELSATAQTEVVKSLESAELNGVNVTKYLDLASRFKQSDIAGGLAGSGGSWREALKTAAGSQDEVSKIVGDWQKIRSGEAISSLPTGPATDSDIRLALKPLPENANAEYMDMYLRGLAKAAEYKQRYAQAKADFITENGSLRGKGGDNFGRVWAERRKVVMDEIKADPRFMAQQAKPSQQAPAQAIEYLRQNPQFSEQFKAKYGYLPESVQ